MTSAYRRAEGSLRSLIDLVSSWEERLTEAGFDVVDIEASLNRQRTIGITVTGNEDDLRRALDLLGAGPYWISTSEHWDSTTRRASLHDIPGVTYVKVDAVQAGGDPR